MTDTGTVAAASDSDPLVRRWRESANRARQIAADLARKITAGELRPYAELPPIAALTREYDASDRTISNAKSLLAGHGFLKKEGRRLVVAASRAARERPPVVNGSVPRLEPLDPGEPYALRMRLTRSHWHLVLKFDGPPTSESGAYEASWAGGYAAASTEDALMAMVLAALGDCGDKEHTWVTVSKDQNPASHSRALLTQQLLCPRCESRERVLASPPDLLSALERARRYRRAG
jgi:Bacterial regulatory proteins, gntR family